MTKRRRRPIPDPDPSGEWEVADTQPARPAYRRKSSDSGSGERGGGATSKALTRAFQRALREQSKDKQQRHATSRAIAKVARGVASAIAALALLAMAVTTAMQAKDVGPGLAGWVYLMSGIYFLLAFVSYAVLHGFFTLVLGVTE